MHWLFFALCAPLMYATSNVIDKYALEQHTAGIMDYMAFASLGSLSLALYFYVTGTPLPDDVRFIWPALLSGLLTNFSYLIFAFCLTKSDSYRLTPYFLLIPIFLILIDVVFFGASVTIYHWLAIGLAMLGGIILNISNNPDSKLQISTESTGLMMLFSVSILTCSILLMDKLSDTKNTDQFIMLQSFGFACTTLVYLSKKTWRTEIVHGFRDIGTQKVMTFAVNDAADLFGNWLFVAAVALAPSAGFVSLALGIQPFYVILLVYTAGKFNPALLNETLVPKKVIQSISGALLITLGLFLLATHKLQ
ncbi:hypothetical protein DF027_07645 [Burkholderia cenocepacia]|uniref:EamA family transporter n=2 Tax=Burkholderia cepacia complex TaxID=87882 RepID=UPI000F55BA57|nr:EamA family transporter [Burkholderia cenocepacia]RQV38949.1 hypothetical protein DF028_18505 [Burkholderia cenocepacia]RQV48280.1 hypothetical protein DF027_07645 [Burkholderia cenocepacia]RQV80495.1 hypothetical protein DF010_08170 [Burkholderia cenocepacia]